MSYRAAQAWLRRVMTKVAATGVAPAARSLKQFSMVFELLNPLMCNASTIIHDHSRSFTIINDRSRSSTIRDHARLCT
jgi:hypothetical protein